jgi:hypothetical protein
MACGPDGSARRSRAASARSSSSIASTTCALACSRLGISRSLIARSRYLVAVASATITRAARSAAACLTAAASAWRCAWRAWWTGCPAQGSGPGGGEKVPSAGWEIPRVVVNEISTLASPAPVASLVALWPPRTAAMSSARSAAATARCQSRLVRSAVPCSAETSACKIRSLRSSRSAARRAAASLRSSQSRPARPGGTAMRLVTAGRRSLALFHREARSWRGNTRRSPLVTASSEGGAAGG